MSDDGPEECPMCCTELDLTDRSIQYCECGFQMCLWCYNRILEEARKENIPARCPNCRSDYDQNKISMQHIDAEELEEEKRKLRERERPKASGTGKQHRGNLANIRVVQPNLVYAVGLILDICHEEVLKEPEFFGQFGKTVKVSVNRNNQYASAMAKHGPTGSAYVTFKRPEDALRCIKLIDGALWRGKPVKACFGTTKYCNAFLKGMPCNNPDCLYLHELADEADCLTKEEVAAGLLPARFLAMGATNTFKPRLTINVIPNAVTSAAQAAAAAAAASGQSSAAICAAAAAAGGISRTHSQHAAASTTPRVLTIPSSSSLTRGRDSMDNTNYNYNYESGNNSAWESPGHGGPLTSSMSGPINQYPPVSPPAPKGMWATAVAGGAAGLAAAVSTSSLPPPPSDKVEWPTLAGAPSNGSNAGNDSNLDAIGRAPSGGATMAEQLARAASSGGVDTKAARQGKKLLPLSSPGKMKPLGKAVAPRSSSPSLLDGGVPSSNGNGVSSSGGLSGAFNQLGITHDVHHGGRDPTIPPPPPQTSSNRAVAPPPGFGAIGQQQQQQQQQQQGPLVKKVPPPPGFGAPPASQHHNSGGGGFSPFSGPPLVGGSLFEGGNGTLGQQQDPVVPPPPGVSRRQHSRFAFAHSEAAAAAAAAAGRGTLGDGGGGAMLGGQGQHHADFVDNGSFFMGGQQQHMSSQHEMMSPSRGGLPPSPQDANAFFKSLFPGATVNVAPGPPLPASSGALSPPGFRGQQQQQQQQQQQPMYNPLADMFPSQQVQQATGPLGIPPGLALLRQLQNTGAPSAPGAGVSGAPPGFGGMSQTSAPPGFGLPL